MNLDINKQFPNQRADNDPTECAGITASDIAGNILGFPADPDFTYASTFRLLGQAASVQGTDPVAALQACVFYGVLPSKDETFTAKTVGELYAADIANYTPAEIQEALLYVLKGVKSLGIDYDAVVNHLQTTKTGVSIAMKWYSTFTSEGYGNIVATNADGSFTTTGGGPKTSILTNPTGSYTHHNVACYDEGDPRGLTIKPWLGDVWGEGGYGYLPRDTFNQVVLGSYGFDPNAKRWFSICILLAQRFPTLLPDLPALLKLGLTPGDAPVVPVDITHTDILYPDWVEPSHIYHNVGVLADLAGVDAYGKEVIRAVIYGESGYNNNAKCYNKNSQGVVTSTDAGICQINSYFHCGPGKDFPSLDYVVAHPEEAAAWMVKMYQEGLIKQWCAYTNGRYLQFMGKIPQ